MSFTTNSIPLCAGQHTPVGVINISRTAEHLTVQYVITNFAYQLEQTHFHVALAANDIPNWPQNLVPGQFEHHATHDGVIETTYSIPMRPEWEDAAGLWGAAHAVVQARRVPTTVVLFKQGTQSNGAPVPADRSIATNALAQDCPATWAPGQPATWATLGCGGHITVDFGVAIPVTSATKLFVYEITWGPYFAETAKVEASPDGLSWVVLGEASNGRPQSTALVNPSSFTLAGLSAIKQVRMTDTTRGPDTKVVYDGYDLDGIALSGSGSETAWALSSGCPVGEALLQNWGRPFFYDFTTETVASTPVEAVGAVETDGTLGDI